MQPFGIPEKEPLIEDELEKFLDLRAEHIKTIIDESIDVIHAMRHTSLERANRNSKPQVFLEGDEIIVRMNHVKGVAHTKWGPLYSEPNTITRVITDTCVEAIDEFGKLRRLHIDRIKLYKRPSDEAEINLDTGKNNAQSNKSSPECPCIEDHNKLPSVVIHPACFTKQQRNQGIINQPPISVPAPGGRHRAARNRTQTAPNINRAVQNRIPVRNNPSHIRNVPPREISVPLLPVRQQRAHQPPSNIPVARNIINNTPAIAQPPRAVQTQPVSRTRAAIQTAAALITGTRQSTRTKRNNRDEAYVYY
jgi:hypothetical protein